MVKLSPKQEKIVYYDGPNPLSVEAGPGAGKTRVIIERVKYLLNEKKVAPESMLVITFTRKAADELKDRLTEGKKILDNLKQYKYSPRTKEEMLNSYKFVMDTSLDKVEESVKDNKKEELFNEDEIFVN